MKLLIVNHINCHYEIIESIIVKYYEILQIDKNTPIDIYLSIFDNFTFKNYIHNKYPNIKFQFISDYDYYINCTIYDKDFDNLEKNKSNKKYISHQITERLEKNKNVYFLTPLSKSNFIYADILPYSNNKIKSDIPIYIIQGCIASGRRNFDLLKKILDNTYNYKFIIKLIGYDYEYNNQLEKYKNKIIIKSNLDFVDFHKEFLNAYCILPLISKNTHKHYYINKLTSTINYARGYELKCLIDKDLQNIYNLNNVEIYNNIDDIVSAFNNTLKIFYSYK